VDFAATACIDDAATRIRWLAQITRLMPALRNTSVGVL
jgi:hypothetical protein